MVSIITVTLNRYDLALQCLPRALETAGTEYEFLSVDNGSEDKRVIDLVQSLNPVYHRLNKTNEGYAPMLNQMILRAKGDYICTLDPDLGLCGSWAKWLVDANKELPWSGMSGYHCVQQLSPVIEMCGVRLHHQVSVHGVKFCHKRIYEKVGAYVEDFVPYGCEDADMNVRVHYSGFMNYYLTAPCIHHGDDVQEKTPYRMAKWAALDTSSLVLKRQLEYYMATKDYYIPWPGLR